MSLCPRFGRICRFLLVLGFPSFSAVVADVRPVGLGVMSPLTDAGFGTAADVTGTTAVVTTAGGASGVNSLGTSLAHIFVRDAGTGAWSLARQIGPVLPAGQGLGNYGVSVALDGDTVVVGAPVLFGVDPADGYDGRVFIHKRNTGGSGVWGRVKLINGAMAGVAQFGFGDRLALSGDSLAVRTAGNRLERSSVRIFLRNQGGAEQWGEVAIIRAPDTTGGGGIFDLNDDGFGQAMALEGDILACGLPDAGDVPSEAGVHVHERSLGGPNGWGRAALIRASDIPGALQIGHALALSGSRLLVSGVAEVAGVMTTRVWWLVRGAGGGWSVESEHSVADAAVSGFGQSVALSGEWAAVMAKRTTSPVTARREVFLFQRQASGWSLRAVLPGLGFDEGASAGFTVPPGVPPEFVNALRARALASSLVPREKPALGMGDGALLHQSASGSTGTTGGLTVREQTAGGLGYVEAAVLRPSVPTSESFGEVVAASGNWLAIGDPDDDEAVTDSGAVWLFNRNTVSNDRWYLVSKIKAPVPRSGAHFGASVAILQHGFEYSLAVGAPDDTVGAVTSGLVYTFGRFGDGLMIEPAVPSSNQGYGHSLAMTPLRNTAGTTVGVRLVVGVNGHDLPGAANAGKADVLEFFTGLPGWALVRTLTASDAAPGDSFGWSVAIDGDTVAVGALTAGTHGAAYVFQRGTGAAHDYPQVKKVLPGDTSSGLFPNSLALQGDTLVGGTFTLTSGSAFVYGRHQGGLNQWGWAKTLRPTAPGGSGDGFGLSVALHGDLILVGAQGDDVAASSNGAGWLFQRNRGGAGQWGIAARLSTNTGDPTRLYGLAVAIANDTLVLGAPNDDEAGLDVGAAHLLRTGSYEFWAEAQNLLSLPAGSELPEADPDSDGESNLLEFMIGTHPRNPASRPQPAMAFDPATRRLSLSFLKPAHSQAGLKIEGEGRSLNFGSFSFSDAETTENSAVRFTTQWRGAPPAGALMRLKATYPSW